MTPVISLALLLALLQTDPARQGIAEFQAGDYRAARAHLEQAPATPESALYLALTRAALGDCAAAVPQLKARFDSAPLRRIAGLALAQCEISEKQFTAAGQAIAALETEFPADPDVLYLSAAFHLKAWNDALYRMYKSAPSSYRVDQLSAEVFETQSKYPEAIAEYRRAIEKNPQAIDLHFRLGRAILMQSHEPAALEQARQQFVAELALNPYDAVAEYQVAQILSAQRKTTEAAPHFERAAQLRPDFPEALIAVAKLRTSAQRYAEAVALLEHAVQLQPRGEAAHYNLMLAYRNAGRAADAQREKAVIDQLQRPPEGEFTDFLKRLDGKRPRSETACGRSVVSEPDRRGRSAPRFS